MKKNISMRLVCAALVLLALCGGVIAAELGVFGHFGMQSEWNANRLAQLDEAAPIVGETVYSEAGFALTLEQAYCDGQRLYFSYTLDGDGFSLGDGAQLPDGAVLNIWDRADELIAPGVIQGFQEVELPEVADSGTPIPIVLTVIDGGKEGRDRFIHVPFSVSPSARTQLTGSLIAPDYTADAALSMTEVEIYGEVTVTGPSVWNALYQHHADSDEEDYVVDYQLIAGGETLHNKEYLYGASNDTSYGIALRYDLPQSCSSLILRPVRYLSGECADEDIVLR